jgi:putative DNA primase/helicase
MRYVADWSRWMLYDGAVWQRDETMRVFDEARAICQEHAELPRISAADRKRLRSARTVAAVISLARTDQRTAAIVDQWDGDEFAINCDGEVHQLDADCYSRPALPGDYFTKSTAVKPAGDCPMWIEFLQTVTAGDAALMDYLQRVCGYCLTGSTVEQCLFFLYGPGGNGKSTFVSTISGIMGDYARTAAIDTFSASNSDRHPTDLANLQGARLVTATETAEGRRWDETRIKTLTGGDLVSARFMRQDFFTYRPAFKLVVSGNHKPQLKGVDEAWRRRMQIVPFTVRIPPDKRMFGFDALLRIEWPGILQWMIEGARHWRILGLAPPPAVVEATNEYLESEDVLGSWIEETISFVPYDPAAFVRRQHLFESWQTYCKKTGEPTGSRKAFIAALNRREGFVPARDPTGDIRGYRGIIFRPAEAPNPEFDL